MKTIILQRHGDYDGIVDLTSYGKRQMELAGQWIERSFPGKRAVISGTEPHLVESAGIIGQTLATRDGQFKELNAPGSLANIPGIARLVGSWGPGCDVLVVVTSLPAVRDFAYHYITNVFGHPSPDRRDLLVDMGGTVVLELETKLYVRIASGSQIPR